MLDLECVVDRLRLERVVLFGNAYGAPAATAFAARHPEIVSNLILVSPISSGADAYKTPEGDAFRALREGDWKIYTEAVAHIAFGWNAGEQAEKVAALLRDCVSQEVSLATHRVIEAWDITSFLTQVRAPTLVIHPREVPWPPAGQVRAIATSIPDCRLVTVEGGLGGPWAGEMDGVAAAVSEFLGEGLAAAPRAELPEGMSAILFADIVNSTALTERLGDDAFRGRARELDEALRKIIRETDGTPIEGKLLGDGVLSVFSAAKNAIDAAVRFRGASESVGLGLHLGIHAGDVIREEGNVYGGAVNIASRISSESAPGEVLVSQTVRDLARTSADVSFEDRGELELKGVGEPVRVYEVRWKRPDRG
jgi:class 3 adenylate cyclase